VLAAGKTQGFLPEDTGHMSNEQQRSQVRAINDARHFYDSLPYGKSGQQGLTSVNQPAASDNSKSPQDAAIRYEPAAAVS
jgi:hypothetical protein